MLIGGLQKTTLIDYPKKIAATVFLAGCNFRCPFCHNPELVFPLGVGFGSISEKDFFHFLDSRKGRLEGVCITGGEPTLQKDLLHFIRKIKKRGFLVKLDTNGSRPDVLRRAFKEKILDYVAMDIKNSLEKYGATVGAKVDLERIKLSAQLIRNSEVDYEFRTTVAPKLHCSKDLLAIAKWLKGSRKYVLQKYDFQGKILSEEYKQQALKSKKILDLRKEKKKIEKYFERMTIR